MYLGGLRAGAVKEYREEADGDVEDLARYLMFVDLLSLVNSSLRIRAYTHKGSPLLVDGDQA
jgi:hypothetical protein